MLQFDTDAPPTMKITYDREVDALYIRFKDTTVTTKHIEDGIALDYDAANHLAGIEILDAAQRVGNPETLHQVVFASAALHESVDQSSVVKKSRHSSGS